MILCGFHAFHSLFDGPALRSKTGFNIYLTFEGERDTICNLSIKGVLQLIKRWRLRQRKTARSCSSPSPLTFQGQPPSSTKVPLELGRFSLVTIWNSIAFKVPWSETEGWCDQPSDWRLGGKPPLHCCQPSGGGAGTGTGQLMQLLAITAVNFSGWEKEGRAWGLYWSSGN